MNLVAGADLRHLRVPADGYPHDFADPVPMRQRRGAFTKRLQHLSDGIPQSAGVGLFFQTYQCCMRLVSVAGADPGIPRQWQGHASSPRAYQPHYAFTD